MYLHRGGLISAWSAAQGGRSGEKAGAEVQSHLDAHRKAVGLDGVGDVTVGLQVGDISFTEILSLLGNALNRDGIEFDGTTEWPWLVDIYPGYVIVDIRGELYRLPVSFDEQNRPVFGTPVKVSKVYVDLPAQSAAAHLVLPDKPRRQVMFHLKMKDPPASFHAAAVPGETDDLIWKEIIQVSATFRPGTGEPFVVDQPMVDALYESFAASVLNVVPITASHHWEEFWGIIPAEETKGFVQRLVKEDERLYAGLKIADQETLKAILIDKTIQDVSIYAWPDFHDQRTDKVWPWVLVHLLLTNYPQLPDLAPFGVKPESVAATVKGASYQPYMEVSIMPDKIEQPAGTQPAAITPEELAELGQYRRLKAEGLSIDTLKAQQASLKGQARALEVQSIIAALQGTGARVDVQSLEGYRHYPAVIAAVKVALKQENVSASIAQDGKSPLDNLVLGVINALPAEARIKLEQPPHVSRATEDGQTPPGAGQAEPTDENLAQFEKQVGL
jgi:hypothetical protein